MNLSSGGLAILAIAAIWFLVFLPSLVKSDRVKLVAAEKVQTSKEFSTSTLSETAKLALAARRGRTLMATIASVSFVVAGLSVLEVVASGSALPLAIGSTVTTALFTWLTVNAHRKYVSVLAGTVRRAVPVSTPTKRVMPDVEIRDTKTWQPGELPKQSYLQTGAIEIVELADVVSIENEKHQEEIADIDEILRRRRHVG
jgi:type II secretory pathway component PulM